MRINFKNLTVQVLIAIVLGIIVEQPSQNSGQSSKSWQIYLLNLLKC